jgi:hypothetical protein
MQEEKEETGEGGSEGRVIREIERTQAVRRL